MAGIYDVADQTSGLPTFQTPASAVSSPYSDPAYAQSAHEDMLRGGKPPPSLIGGALSSAVHGVGGQIGGFAQAVGQAAGLKGVANWGAGVAQSQGEAAQAAGRPELEGDWTSPSGIAYNLTKQLPMLAGTVAAARYGGAPVARMLGVGEELGGSIAAGASMFPTAVGGNVETAKNANGGQLSTSDAYKALGLGVPEAAIQSYMPGSLAATLKRGAAGDLPKRLLMGGGINALVGGGQAAASSALTDFMDPGMSVAQRAHNMVQAAIGGAIGGGIIGATIHGLSPEKAPLPKADPEATTTEELNAATSNLDPDKAKVQPGANEGDQGTIIPPEAATPTQATDLSSPMPAANTIDGNVPAQIKMFTPEETGERATKVAALRQSIEENYKIPANAERSFLDKMQATDTPELIKALRGQAEYYLDAKKGVMPKWFEHLATDLGVMSDGRVVDIHDEIASRQKQADDITQSAQDKYNETMGKLSAQDAQSPQGLLEQKQAAKVRDKAAAEAKGHQDEIARLSELTDAHATADKLPDVYARREVPDTLTDKPQANELWQTMMSIGDHAPTKDLRDRAQQAADLLRQNNKKGIELAQQVHEDYLEARRQRMSVTTDEAAPSSRANDNTPGPDSAPATDLMPPKDVVNDNAPYAKDAANSNENLPKPTPGMTNENRKFGTDRTEDNGAVMAGPNDANRVRIDEQLTRDAANTDKNPLPGERPDVNSVRTDEAAPGVAENENRKFGSETLNDPASMKTDADIENEAMRRDQAVKDKDTNARLLNDNVAGYPNLAPRPEALAFARDAASMTDAPPPVKAGNKNQTPKQQAAIEKAKATRAANKVVKPDPTKPNGDILGLMAEPAVKRQGDDDIAYLVGNKDKPIGDAGKLLEYLSQHGDSDFTKLLATRFQRLLGDKAPTVSFGTVDDIKAADPNFKTSGLSAAYDPNTNHVWLLDRNNLQSNFMHEMVHAVTHQLIDQGGPLADRLQALMDKSVAEAKAQNLGDMYAHTDLHEFVAEAFSNPEFQKFLADIPSARKTWSLFDVFKDAISKMLNLPLRARSLLDDVLTTGSHMIDQYAGNPAKPGSVSDGNANAAVFGKYADAMLSKAREAMANDGRGAKWLKGKLRETALGWNTFTHIADHYGRLLPPLKALQNAMEGRDVLNSRLHQMHKVACDAFGELPPKAQDAINTLMGWTRHSIDPRLSWEQQPQFHKMKNAEQMRALVKQANDDWNRAKNLGGDAAHNAYNLLDFSNKSDDYMRSAITAHEYGASAFKELDNPAFAANHGEQFRLDQTGIHSNPRAAMDWWKGRLNDTLTALEKVRDETISPKLEVGEAADKKSAKSSFDEVDKLVGDIRTKVSNMERAPYFHEGRQGDYFVSAKLNLGDGKQLIGSQVDRLQKHLEGAGFGQYGISRIGDNPSIFIRVKTPEQMEMLRRAMVAAQDGGMLDKTQEIKHGMPEKVDLFNSVAPAYVQRIVELARRDPNFSKEAEAELRSRWLDMVGESSLPKAYQTREFAQGWNKDMMHNFVMRSQVAANSLSSAAMRSSVSDAMVAMDNDVAAHKAGTDVNKTLAAQQVANEVTRREAERNWKVNTTGADYVRALNHMFHLGFSVPYMIEQLSQIPMLLLPELGKTHGFVKSATAIYRVTPLAFKVMRAIISGPHALDAVVTPEGLAKHVDEKTAKFIMDIVNRAGLDLGSFTREYGVAAKGGEEGAISKAMRMANAPAIYAETFGRVLAALSARELHGTDTPGHIEYAKHVLDQSMMSWQPWNTSRQTSKTGFLGSYSQLAMSFTGYQIRLIEKLYRELHGALGGETPETKAASRKFLAMHLGAATCIAGTLGVPFMGAFAGATSKLANFLTGKDDYDVEGSYREFLAHTFGKDVGQVIAKGLPNALGVDFSDLGDQDLLPFTKLIADRRKLEDSVGDWAKSAMGSPFSTGLNFLAGARDIGAGLPLQGISKMLPTALKGPYDAYRVAMYGYEDKNGTQKPIDADARDVLLRVAGLHGATESDYNDKARMAAGLKETRMERESYIKQRLMLSQQHHDAEGYQSAVQDAASFGKDHPLYQPMASFSTARSRQLQMQARARAFGMPIGETQKDIMDHGQQLNW